jgi:hypothetical protein
MNQSGVVTRRSTKGAGPSNMGTMGSRALDGLHDVERSQMLC